MIHPTHDQILTDRVDRATDRTEQVWARYHHEVAVRAGIEQAIRDWTSYTHISRDEMARNLLEAIDRSYEFADKMCPLPDTDVLEGNATTGMVA